MIQKLQIQYNKNKQKDRVVHRGWHQDHNSLRLNRIES